MNDDQQMHETRQPEAKAPQSPRPSGSMQKWVWLMGRQKSKVKATGSHENDDAAQAAANAIAQMLGDSRRPG